MTPEQMEGWHQRILRDMNQAKAEGDQKKVEGFLKEKETLFEMMRKNAPVLPKQQTTHQKQQQPYQAKRQKMQLEHNAKMQKLHAAQKHWEAVTKQAQAQTQTKQAQQAPAQQKSAKPKKESFLEKQGKKLDKYLEAREKKATEKQDKYIEKKKKEIGSLIRNFFTAKKKAPEQERKLSKQNKQAIERSVAELAEPDVTPDQGIAISRTILNQVGNPTVPKPQTNLGNEGASKGWLTTNVIEPVIARLETLNNRLSSQQYAQTGMQPEKPPKPAKADLLNALDNNLPSQKNTSAEAGNTPALDEQNDPNKQEPPGSKFQ